MDEIAFSEPSVHIRQATRRHILEVCNCNESKRRKQCQSGLLRVDVWLFDRDVNLPDMSVLERLK